MPDRRVRTDQLTKQADALIAKTQKGQRKLVHPLNYVLDSIKDLTLLVRDLVARIQVLTDENERLRRELQEAKKGSK